MERMSTEYNRLKAKHPDSIILFDTEKGYELFGQDIEVGKKILNLDTNHFAPELMEYYLFQLVKSGKHIIINDEIDVYETKLNSRRETHDPIENNDMPRKKKEKTPQVEPVKTTKSAVDETTPKEKKSESQSATQGEAAERKPREPQMVTVNGDKVTHGHAYQSKTNPEDWYFTAKINGQQLKPQKMDPADLAAYQQKELTVPQLMERYYPTKLMPRVPDVSYQVANVLPGPEGNLTIDKFNVYKETDETRADYGKYKFYAQVGDKKMSTTASREDLNAYFDRVATPGQLVERNFGDRLHLQSHYEQFRLPEGIDPKGIRIAKDKEDNKWKVSVDLGEGRGRSSRQEISFDDGYSLFKTNTATREQIAAKYLNDEIGTKLAAPLSMEKSASMKM
ncbi:DNA mismatch repair protein MutS [uncultured Muribaculum sp.]|uniref:DNA mismatch repair protein MutS n=1 Tax=uncultured Muribaculum sp. TaxID=1918613 RepID=UPI0027297B6A|nr:DNA mismatch repair protein MutS [uncultured Muribaculum sp.]